MPDPFALARQAARELKTATGVKDPAVAVVLGSGWGPAADQLGDLNAEVPVSELAGFHSSGLIGHAGTVQGRGSAT